MYELHVIRAQGLPSRQNKTPNTYARIEFGTVVRRTRTVFSSKSPEWDERFAFSEAAPYSEITLIVKRRLLRYLPGSTILGTVRIDVKKLLERTTAEDEVALRLTLSDGKHGFQDRGEVRVRLRAYGTRDAGAAAIVTAVRAVGLGPTPEKISTAVSLEPGNCAGAVVAVLDQPDMLKMLETLMKKLDVFAEIIDKASKVHPYVNIAWQVLSSLYKVVKSQVERDQRIVVLVGVMCDTYALVSSTDLLREKIPTIEDTVKKILSHTVECAIFIQEYMGHGFGGRTMRQALSDYDVHVNALSDTFTMLRDSFDKGINVQAALSSFRILETVEEIDTTLTLQQLNPADMDFSMRPECFPDTRVDALKFVVDWATNPSHGENVLWVNGMAGVGKSTLATTIANIFCEMKRLGAFIFHNRDIAEGRNPAIVVRTIAYRLAEFDSRIAVAIASAIKNNPNCARASMRRQFHTLIVEPLASPSLSGLYVEGPIVIVVDALDECGTAPERWDLLQVLANGMAQLPPYIRVLVTSRAEHDICNVFRSSSNILEYELGATFEASGKDILTFLTRRMATIQNTNKDLLPLDWPGDTRLHRLAHLTSGLFIWASTAALFLETSIDPEQSITTLLRPESLAAPGIDHLYRTALESSGILTDRVLLGEFQAVVGIVIAAYIPLSSTAIDKLLHRGEGALPAARTISRFACLFHSTPFVRVLHPSFAEFLMDRERCGHDYLFIDQHYHHYRLTALCLATLRRTLKYNMCGLALSAKRPEGLKLPEDVAYASGYWMHHLDENLARGGHFYHDLEPFLYRHLLHWLECMSILGWAQAVPRNLLSISTWLLFHHPNKDLYDFVIEAMKMFYNSSFTNAIAFHPLLVYSTALLFAPMDGLFLQVFRRCEKSLPWIAGGYRKPLTTVSRFIRHSYRNIRQVVFSPDSKLIAASSYTDSVYLWNVDTLVELDRLQRSDMHISTPDECNCLHFSVDNQYIASSGARSIIVWEAMSGRVKFDSEDAAAQTHDCNDWTTVAISPNNQHIIFGNGRGTIQALNMSDKENWFEPLQRHSAGISSLACHYTDNNVFASGSAVESTIRVWRVDNSCSLVCLATLRADQGPGIKHLVFVSPGRGGDGCQLVSSNLHGVQRWDVKAGQRLHAVTLTPPSPQHLNADLCALSQDASMHAYARSSHSEFTWVYRGDNPTPFLGLPTGPVSMVSLSGDGKRLLDLDPKSDTITIWDLPERYRTSHFSAYKHIVRVYSLSLSLDSSRIASRHGDFIGVWDTTSGRQISGFSDRGVDRGVAIAISSDGSQVAGSDLKQLYIWDVDSEAIAFRFSPLGATNEPTATSREQLYSGDVAFSLSGPPRVVSALTSGIWGWNTKTGECLFGPLPPSDLQDHPFWPTTRHSFTVLAFSSQGDRFVSGCERTDTTQAIRIWDASSGTLLAQHIIGIRVGCSMDSAYCIGRPLQCVAFTPNGQHIVVLSTLGESLQLDIGEHTLENGPAQTLPSAKTVLRDRKNQWIVANCNDYTRPPIILTKIACVEETRGNRMLAWLPNTPGPMFGLNLQDTPSASNDSGLFAIGLETGEVIIMHFPTVFESTTTSTT
ncbi:hypothetical protein PLICRDRAFT_50823 [Plicaturopsis crispa FD-325 SS-3]|nr:hypothetical protein PLICRDRAFT_50823 [Plicaturopsis crispa FD-325 SS-3]